MDLTQAKIEMSSYIAEVFKPLANDILQNSQIVFLFDRVQQRSSIDKNRHTLRVHIMPVESQMSAFSTNNAQKKRWINKGILKCQFFSPATETGAGFKQDALAQALQDALRRQNLPGKIWFRRASIKDVRDEDTLLRIDVVAEYEYRQVA